MPTVRNYLRWKILHFPRKKCKAYRINTDGLKLWWPLSSSPIQNKFFWIGWPFQALFHISIFLSWRCWEGLQWPSALCMSLCSLSSTPSSTITKRQYLWKSHPLVKSLVLCSLLLQTSYRIINNLPFTAKKKKNLPKKRKKRNYMSRISKFFCLQFSATEEI